MKKIFKKVASFLLVFILAFSLMPAVSLAYVTPMAASGPTIITTEAQLRAMSTRVGAYYRLGNNIHLTRTMHWTPIGTNSAPFRGTFDGGGYSIYDMYITTPINNAGMFGRTDGAILRNVRIERGSVNTVADYVGGIVGRATNTVISDSYVRSQITGRRLVGGIVGCANNTIVERSFTTGNVRATWNPTSSTNYANAGGIVGRADNNTIVRNTFSEGDIHAMNFRAGGIVGGLLSSTVINSYAIGTVTAARGSAGGIVGFRNAASTIENTAAINRAITLGSTNTTIGRVVRDGNYNRNRALNTMVLRNSRGIITPSPLGLTTRHGLCTTLAQFRSAGVYIDMGWDFNNVWVMDSSISYYPVLRDGTRPENIRIFPDILELTDQNPSGILTAVIDNPASLPSTWIWTAYPLGVVSLSGSGDSRIVTAIGTIPPGGFADVLVTVRTLSGAEDTALVRIVDTSPSSTFAITLATRDSIQLGEWINDNLQQNTAWHSTNPSVASVDSTGLVMAESVGTATISAGAGDFEIDVRVISGDWPTGIYIEDPFDNPDNRFLGRGETLDLTALLSPIGTSRNLPIVWHSNNPNVVVIEDFNYGAGTATIRGTGEGFATITASVVGDPSIAPATIIIEVRVLPNGLFITTDGIHRPNTPFAMMVGDEEGFVAVFDPRDTTDQAVSWWLEDEHGNAVPPSVAYLMTVGNDVIVRAVGVGDVYLVVEADNHDIGDYRLRINIEADPLNTYVLADWSVFVDENGLIHPRRGNITDRDAFISGIGIQGVGRHTANLNNHLISATGWNHSTLDNPKAWWAVIPAYGYRDFTVTFDQRSNLNAPNTFTLQYSLDGGGSWRTVPIDIELASYDRTFTANIPTDVLTAPMLYLRWVAGSRNASGGLVTVDNPISFLSNVIVTGNR